MSFTCTFPSLLNATLKLKGPLSSSRQLRSYRLPWQKMRAIDIATQLLVFFKVKLKNCRIELKNCSFIETQLLSLDPPQVMVVDLQDNNNLYSYFTLSPVWSSWQVSHKEHQCNFKLKFLQAEFSRTFEGSFTPSQCLQALIALVHLLSISSSLLQ